jgi:hypothetical protein
VLTLPLLPVWLLGSHASLPLLFLLLFLPEKDETKKIKQAIKLRTSGGVAIELNAVLRRELETELHALRPLTVDDDDDEAEQGAELETGGAGGRDGEDAADAEERNGRGCQGPASSLSPPRRVCVWWSESHGVAWMTEV